MTDRTREPARVTRELHVGGVVVPTFFYGTAWKEGRTSALTAQALAAGFRAIDTANQRKHYVEAEVGAALKTALERGELTRAALFLQTKFTYARGQDQRIPYDPSADYGTQVAQSFASSLEHLATDYLDSYVLHGPERGDRLTAADREVWHAMSELCRAGKLRLLGVSNVTLAQLAELWEHADVKPVFVQNRCYASTGWDRDVRGFCREHGLHYQGFSLLTANPHVLADAGVRRAAERLGATPSQVVFRFALEVGMITLTGTSSAEHAALDLGVYDLPALTEAERLYIEQLGAPRR
jgi:diketogulonate reductase-like aldo/keto reductase